MSLRSLFTTPAPSLTDQLAAKADQLRVTEADQLDLSSVLSHQASAASEASYDAALQAKAVEEALKIITAAGVTL